LFNEATKLTTSSGLLVIIIKLFFTRSCKYLVGDVTMILFPKAKYSIIVYGGTVNGMPGDS